jgi:hypothetical protein
MIWRTLPLLLSIRLLAQPVDGFVESRVGGRLQSDSGQDSASIREVRLQAGQSWFVGPFDVQAKADFLYDDLATDRGDVDLDSGDGWVDLRTAWLAFRPTMWMDVKAGRQVLTWGTGDLLFLNDMFPKDWQSFFNGRDVEYLKAPSDAVWTAVYQGDWTLDVVWTPQFDSDRYLDGDGISFFSGMYTPDNPLPTDEPTDSEWALRLARNFGSVETALYAYQGFWKSPGGMNAEGVAVFPELRVWGASLLMPAGDGLFNLEGSYYDSLEDRNGDNPFLNNSEVRFLAGYNRELAANFMMGLQAYVEWIQDYDAYETALPPGQPQRDELREVTTLRLTRLLMNQTLTLSGFLFYSPTDQDGYLRASAEYKWTDQLATTLGVNLFAGKEEHTFFGQFENNSNVYLAIRRWF